MYRIVFTDWKDDLKKVSLTRLLKEVAGLSLGEAKKAVDALLSGEEFFIETPSEAITKKLKSEAIKLGAICKMMKVKKHQLIHA